MPVKVEQINEYLFSDTVQSQKTKSGSIAILYASSMLDVSNIYAVLCVSLLALQPLINLKFFLHRLIY